MAGMEFPGSCWVPIAEDVFRNVSCPVLTVGPDVKPCNTQEMKIKKVLLATHFEAGSTAPAHAALLCNEFGAELTVLHVADENKAAIERKNEQRARATAHLRGAA